MAYVIGMVSQKGGVGKSTLARMMAREFTVGGLRAKIADLDTQQQTCTVWAGRRAENGLTPEILVQSFASVRSALGDAPHFDVIVLDGKPHSSAQTVEIAQASDLVVIPTGQTVDDLHPGVLLAHSLTRKGINGSRLAFALLRTTASRRENETARQYLSDAGYAALKGDIPMSTAYGQAADAGRTATETPFRTLNDRATEVAQEMIDKMADLGERSS